MGLERDYLVQNYARYPLALHRGKGCYVYDLDGNRYLDLISGIGVNSLGLRAPAHHQGDSAAGWPDPAYLKPLLSRISGPSGRAPGQDERAAAHLFLQFGHGGDGRRAQDDPRAWQRAIQPASTRSISLENSFHGRTFGALSITGSRNTARTSNRYCPAHGLWSGTTSPRWKRRSTKIRPALSWRSSRAKAGFYPVSEAFARRARELADKFNALLVLRRDPMRRRAARHSLCVSVAGPGADAGYCARGQADGLRHSAWAL